MHNIVYGNLLARELNINFEFNFLFILQISDTKKYVLILQFYLPNSLVHKNAKLFELY